jgi:hypothetical protein
MKRKFKGLKLAILIASLLFLVIISVNILHGGHRHNFAGGGQRAAFAQQGQVFEIEKNRGPQMGQGRMFSSVEPRQHDGINGGAFLAKLGWLLLIVGLIVFWLYRRVKRFSRKALTVSPMLEMTIPTRNVELLDEWEKNINNEEK